MVVFSSAFHDNECVIQPGRSVHLILEAIRPPTLYLCAGPPRGANPRQSNSRMNAPQKQHGLVPVCAHSTQKSELREATVKKLTTGSSKAFFWSKLSLWTLARYQNQAQCSTNSDLALSGVGERALSQGKGTRDFITVRSRPAKSERQAA